MNSKLGKTMWALEGTVWWVFPDLSLIGFMELQKCMYTFELPIY